MYYYINKKIVSFHTKYVIIVIFGDPFIYSKMPIFKSNPGDSYTATWKALLQSKLLSSLLPFIYPYWSW